MYYWIVSELFYPEEVSTGYVMTKIAEKLNETEEVGVICGPTNYQSGIFKAPYEISDKIKIKRISLMRLNKNKLFFRLLGFFLLSIGIGYKIIKNIRRNDSVILVTNPPTITLLVPILKKIIGFKLTIIVHDVFPENLASAGILKKNSFAYTTLRSLFNRSYNSADRLIVVGQDMKEIFKNKVRPDMPIEVITNWADHEEVVPLPRMDLSEYYSKDLSEKIVVGFMGNIGRVQGLENLFGILKDMGPTHFEIAITGDGAVKNKLMLLKETYCIDCVSFYDSKPRSQQQLFLNACDIGLVSLSPGMFGLGVPSKVYNLLAAGKPLLYLGDENSEISRYVKENNVGWVFSWNEEEAIKNFLQQLNTGMKDLIKEKGRSARSLVESRFTKDFILARYKNEISQLKSVSNK
jgi:glycosyltransferase involved in cell wall biosynthesis